MGRKSRSISKRVRFEVFKRDGFACVYCGAHPPQVLLQLDHLRPIAQGGTCEIDNLVTACEACNNGKGAVELTQIPESLRAKASRVAEAEEQLRLYQQTLQDKADRLEDEAWAVANALFPPKCKEIRRDWLKSLKNFLEQLGFHSVQDAAEIAYSRFAFNDKRKWAYFCGVCWKRIKAPPINDSSLSAITDTLASRLEELDRVECVAFLRATAAAGINPAWVRHLAGYVSSWAQFKERVSREVRESLRDIEEALS